MNLYSINYELSNPRGNRKTNTVCFRGVSKEEALIRFRSRHKKEKVLKIKCSGILMLYGGDRFDKRFEKMRKEKYREAREAKAADKCEGDCPICHGESCDCLKELGRRQRPQK